jgi:hypothetical protein
MPNKSANPLSYLCRGLFAVCVLSLSTFILSAPSRAKTAVDFDPNLDFSTYKTFAYLGGTNLLEFRPLNPHYISNHVHEAVSRALTKRGLAEVQPDQHPDLVVRYWANSQSNLAIPDAGVFLEYGSFLGGYWAYTYELMSAATVLDGTLTIDLIDPKRKDLAWRLYLEQKIVDNDSIWPGVISGISKAFESYPPTPKQIEEKRKERAEHPPKAQSSPS